MNKISINEFLQIHKDSFLIFELFNGIILNDISIDDVLNNKIPCWIYSNENNFTNHNYMTRIVNDEYIMYDYGYGRIFTRRYFNPIDLNQYELDIMNKFMILSSI